MKSKRKSKPKPKPKLTFEQVSIAATFSDLAFDNPHVTFNQTAKKALGLKPFPNTPNGKAFRKEAKAVFALERAK